MPLRRGLIVLALLTVASSARGSLSSPTSSVTFSRDGERMLVMLSTHPKDDRSPFARLPNGHVIELRATFAKSGVYRVATFQPLWQVDWFSQRCDLLVSDDLRHVARLNRLGFRASWAIAFYDEGRLVRTYDCAFLLPRLRRTWCLPFTTGDWHTVWYDDFALDPDGVRVRVSTARRRLHLADTTIDLGRREFYTFDLAGGELVTRRTAGAWVVWAYGGAVSTVVTGAVFAARWGWRKVRSLRGARGFPVKGGDREIRENPSPLTPLP